MSMARRDWIGAVTRKIRRLCPPPGAASNPLVSADADCRIDVHPTARLGGSIRVSGGSELKVGANCILRGVHIVLANHAHLEMEDGAILDYSTCPLPAGIHVDNGWLRIGDHANIKCSVVVRFGGRMEIGSRTGISPGAEIRCEESVTIGRYCLISYDVCIYDTNTHSLDWRERRERIEQGYPQGTGEIQRPATRPVAIGDDVWIGKRAIIAKGATLGARTIVGMGTVVGGKNIPPDSRVVSGAARVILTTAEQESKGANHD